MAGLQNALGPMGVGDDGTIENDLNVLARVFQLRGSGIIPNRLLAGAQRNAFEVQFILIPFWHGSEIWIVRLTLLVRDRVKARGHQAHQGRLTEPDYGQPVCRA
jgi:hypothetical protein